MQGWVSLRACLPSESVFFGGFFCSFKMKLWRVLWILKGFWDLFDRCCVQITFSNRNILFCRRVCTHFFEQKNDQKRSADLCFSICVIKDWPCKLLLKDMSQKWRILPCPMRMSERLWAVFLASYCGHCNGASASWDISHIMIFFLFFGGEGIDRCFKAALWHSQNRHPPH